MDSFDPGLNRRFLTKLEQPDSFERELFGATRAYTLGVQPLERVVDRRCRGDFLQRVAGDGNMG